MTVTNFIWDELSDNVLLETDENDVVTASYTNRPERFGELLSQKRSGVTSYFHNDGQHSTRNLTDSNEDVTDTFIYTAYGEEVARTGTTTNPFGYKGAVGYYTNEATNDVYVRARTYESAIGCWLSRDPAGFVDGPNLYRPYFVPGGVDPSGLKWIWIGQDYWQASTFGDNLQELAGIVSGNENDWRCIWPVPAWQDPQLYPIASKCDVADVSNLTARIGPIVLMGMDNRLGLGRDFFNVRPNAQLAPTGTLVYSHLRGKSQEGESPIYYMEFMAHNWNRTNCSNGAGSYFDIADYRPNEPAPSYQRASSKRGPHRCWFTKNSRSYLIMCGSRVFGDRFSRVFLRDGSWIKSTETSICVGADPGGFGRWGFQTINGQQWIAYANYQQFLNAPRVPGFGWETHDGKL